MLRSFGIIRQILLGIVLMAGIVVSNGNMSLAAEHPILYLFRGAGCPHCQAEEEFLGQLQKRYPTLEMRWFEIWEHDEFLRLAEALQKAYNIKGAGVPLTFVGETPIHGFRTEDTTGIEIETRVVECLQKGCTDPLDKVQDLPIVQRIRTEAEKQKPQDWQLFPARKNQQ
jgi:hypothetical protein